MQEQRRPDGSDEEGPRAASRIGFGIDRVGTLALAFPRAALACFLVLAALVAIGVPRVDFDSNLRGFFRSDSQTFHDYVNALDSFVDPESQELVLVEGDIGTPENFARLRDLHYMLALAEGAGAVHSVFSLREPGPAGSEDVPLLIEDPEAGLTPELAARIRANPLLGDRLLASDGRSLLYIVTPAVRGASVDQQRALDAALQAAVSEALGDSGLETTIAGFPKIRASMVDYLMQDQRQLNRAGAIIGVLLSFIVFRSITAAVLTAVPAILAGIAVVGLMGLIGVKVTVLSIVVPVLIMILGYTDGMHLSYAFRREREAGRSVVEAERRAIVEVGPACVLSALTTSVAFLSLSLSDIVLFRDFGWTGAVATTGGAIVVLAGHALAALAIGRFWRIGAGGDRSLLTYCAEPCAAMARLAIRFAWPVSIVSTLAMVGLAYLLAITPPEHSVHENLPARDPGNIALNRIDAAHGGAYSIVVVVPVLGSGLTDPATLNRVGKVHEAIEPLAGGRPLSIWSVVEWLGGGADAATGERIERLLAVLPEEERARLVGNGRLAPIIVYLTERPTDRMLDFIAAVEESARAAGGPDVVVTGPTVLTSREATRSINQLTFNLALAVLGTIVLIALAFRDLRAGVVALVPNALPILVTAGVLYVLDRGMQFTSVIALTVAFGVAVDDTVHYLSRYRILGRQGGLEVTSRLIGPVLIGTTLIIVAGLAATLISLLPTVALFGKLVAATLMTALVGSLLILPAIMAGPVRKWFDR